MRPVSAWGRLDAHPHRVVALTERHALGALPQSPGVAHGMGRSYGDVALNPGGTLWLTTGLDRFIAFDPDSGVLQAEAGVLLRDIQRLLAPRGWMLPVTPGTQFVTLGGAIANDVHGKNHHLTGTFADHVVSLVLQRTDGETVACGPAQRPEWFAATAGGLGLTGVIVEAELQLRRVAGPWLETETVPYEGLEAFFRLSGESVDWEHTVSWIDCTRVAPLRGLFLRGRPSARQDGTWRPRRLAVPLAPPLSMVNRLTLAPFNRLYRAMNARHAGRVRRVHELPFLFPLDAIADWNRLYGPRGFRQYQSVVPDDAAAPATAEMLATIAASGEGSMLAVLKTFGPRWPRGPLGFPRPGVTLALDFREHRDLERLFERLDAIVAAAGGRLYPAKDSRMPRALFEQGYPRLAEFLPFRDPGIGSAMSRRLMGS